LISLIALCHFVLAWSSKLEYSATWDEPFHMLGGLSYWRLGDYRVQPENGNLSQRLIGLPLCVATKLQIDMSSREWQAKAPYHLAARTLLPTIEDARKHLKYSRAATAMLSSLLVLVVYGFAGDLFGETSAIGAMLLTAFCPTLLAHGGLATSDACFSLFFVLSLWMIHRSLVRTSIGSMFAVAVAVSGAFLSKNSAPVLIAIGILFATVNLFVWRKVRINCGGRTILIRSRWKRIGLIAGHFLMTAVTALILVWAAYGFRYSGFCESSETKCYFGFQETLTEMTEGTSPALQLIRWCGDHRLLPEAYLYGVAYVLKSVTRNGYFYGSYGINGWWNYFPTAIAVKTPLSTLFVWILAIGVIAFSSVFKHGRHLRGFVCASRGWGLVLMAAFCLFTLCTSHLNIGIRHALPLIMLLHVMSGAAFSSRQAILPLRYLAWMGTAVTIATGFLVFPEYLPYFNGLIAPGTEHKVLLDSNFDWGQDLWNLKTILADESVVQRNEHVYVDYFGPPDAELYCGLPPIPPQKGLPGVYCVSATNLMRVNTGGKWTMVKDQAYRNALLTRAVKQRRIRNPKIEAEIAADVSGEVVRIAEETIQNLRYQRLLCLLSRKQPIAKAGRTIFIYRLTKEDLLQAYSGPVVPEDQRKS